VDIYKLREDVNSLIDSYIKNESSVLDKVNNLIVGNVPDRDRGKRIRYIVLGDTAYSSLQKSIYKAHHSVDCRSMYQGVQLLKTPAKPDALYAIY